MTTRHLLDRASQGDPDAVQDLLAAWLPAVERYVRRRAPRELLLRESGADLAQSVCREALERIGRGAFEYRGDAEFRAWLLGAADLKLRERWRRARADKRDARPDPLPEELPPLEGEGTPSRAAMRGEEAERLRTALDGLEDRARDVVRMAYLEGRSHAEIARLLSIEESHSRTILARSLARLSRGVHEPGA